MRQTEGGDRCDVGNERCSYSKMSEPVRMKLFSDKTYVNTNDMVLKKPSVTTMQVLLKLICGHITECSFCSLPLARICKSQLDNIGYMPPSQRHSSP